LLLLSLGNGILLKLLPSEMFSLYSLLVSEILLMTVCKMLAIKILLLAGLLAWWGELWKAVDTSVPLVLSFCCVAGFTQQIEM